jgi:hypothetical protein
MRFPASIDRTLRAGLVLGVAVAALAGCTKDNLPVPAAAKGLPRLYISDVQYRVRGETLVGGQDALTAMNTAIGVLSGWKDMGTFITPQYVITVDPEILIQTTTHRTIPAEELVDEAVIGATGTVTTRKVMRNPIFYLDYAEITHRVPGYSNLPVLRYDLNMAMKETHILIDKLPVSNADQVVRAIWDKPDSTPPAMGEADIKIYGRDMDPLLAADQRQIVVSRSFPVRYMNQSYLLGESVQNKTPLAVPQPAVFGTPAPAENP